ncbi:MAG: hypothetical protein WCW66_04750 [Patescibacteria group bacterium]|jgi:hypothetical protein
MYFINISTLEGDMPRKVSAAQIFQRRDTREDILCPDHNAVGFNACKEGGRIRIVNCGQSPITIGARRRLVQPGGTTLIARDVPISVGERKYFCK